MLLWEMIFEVLNTSPDPMTKHEISDAIYRQYGRASDPETIRATINEQWSNGNYSFYIENRDKPFRYLASPEYYSSFINGLKGV